MKTLKIVAILTLLSIVSVYGQTDCIKCDIEKLKIINGNLNHLGKENISEFLCTIDTICKTNIEFSQWANELLFNILDKHTELFLTTFDKQSTDKIDFILTEIENPIQDFDYQKLYDKIKFTSTTTEKAEKLKISLTRTANKDGQTIKK